MSRRGRQIASVAVRRWALAGIHARFGLAGRERRRAAVATQVRLAAEELGPAFVKLGQLASVRPDIFAPDLVFELSRLQDHVAPVSAAVVRRVIADEFGAPVDELFADFHDEPVASASIAQVHRAVLRNDYRPVVGDVLPAGTVLAVKVVRPGVEAAIRADIEVARPLVGRLGKISRLAHYGVEALLGEFAESLHSECDLRNEARVADRWAFDFRDDPLVFTPRVVWPLTSRRVMTMEFVDGWRLSELDLAHRIGIDTRALAVHGAEAFMRQVLMLGRFHADLHPANMFVTPDGRICYLDFGIVGTTAPEQRAAIAQVLAATVYGEADRALRYSAQLGLEVPPERESVVRGRVADLMRDTLSVAPRDVRGFAVGFLRIMDDERVTIPVGFGLLVKALVTVEGVARSLHPDIDIVEAAKPFATRLVAQRVLEPSQLWERLPAAIDAAIAELVR